MSYQRTPTDILPTLKVPVVIVFASYRGMPAPDMEQSVVAPLERALTRCDQLDHIESRRCSASASSASISARRSIPTWPPARSSRWSYGEMQNMPPGMLPPSVLKYDASSIPVGNLVITSENRDDKYLLDLADHEFRDELAGIEGLAAAPVFGGVFRQVQIYVHPRRWRPQAVADTRWPASSTRRARYSRRRNAHRQPELTTQLQQHGATPKDFEKIPLWSDGRKVVYLGDVANVVDGNALADQHGARGRPAGRVHAAAAPGRGAAPSTSSITSSACPNWPGRCPTWRT